MGAEQKTHFQIDKTKYIKCRKDHYTGLIVGLVIRRSNMRAACRRIAQQNVPLDAGAYMKERMWACAILPDKEA
jgi:hypothetical protein